MEEKLILSSKEILEKQFEKDVKGYNPDEVDDFLDKIIKDYQTFSAYLKECNEYISSLELNIKKLKDRQGELEIENSQLRSKVSAIKTTDVANSSNIQLLERISQLEKALYSKGVDPKRIH